MTPETEHFLAKARRLLDEAQTTLDVGLYDAAGRAAYLAAFHAAQALIFDRTGRASKTHGGVHAEFQRLTKDDQQIDPALRAFLSRAYNLKATADYETEPSSVVSAERAAEAIATARLFVTRLAGMVSGAT